MLDNLASESPEWKKLDPNTRRKDWRFSLEESGRTQNERCKTKKKTDTESISLYPFLSNLGRFDLMLLMYNNGTNIPAAMKQIPSILQK